MKKLTILLTCLVFAACGGDDDDNGDSGDSGDAERTEQTTGGGSGGNVEGQDAEAQATARNIATALESCYADEQDYGACLDLDQLRADTGLELEEGSGPGQVSFGPPQPDEYVITVTSESGTAFQLGRSSSGSAVRLCTKPGEGGCNEDGSW